MKTIIVTLIVIQLPEFLPSSILKFSQSTHFTVEFLNRGSVDLKLLLNFHSDSQAEWIHVKYISVAKYENC